MTLAPKTAPVLIAYDYAAGLRDALAARFPEETFLIARTRAELDAALARQPEVIFSIKGAALPGPAHGAAFRAPSLRWGHVGGSGYDHVLGWDPDRLTVTNSAGLLAPYLAETTIGALIALNHGLIHYRDRQVTRDWAPRPFRPLAGQTLLVVGLGAIGSEVACRARALDMRVIGLRRAAAPHPHADEVRPLSALDASLAEADAVTLHLRLTPVTAGLFDAARFARMTPSAIFLNSARGGLVDEAALVAALETGGLDGAWCDVFRTEPLPKDSPLWTARNLLITPHSADSVENWPLRFAEFFGDNLALWRAGRPLMNVVTP